MKNKQKVSSDKFTMMTQMPVNKLICKMAVPTIITMLVSAVYLSLIHISEPTRP